MKAIAPAAPKARIGYVLKMFPRLSETFILNEILELEQQELMLRIFSLKHPADDVRHTQATAVRSSVVYVPEKISAAPFLVFRSQLHVARRHGKAWRRTMRNAVRSARANKDRSGLTALSQACCIIREMGGISHLHAHYANVPAKIALLVHRLTGVSFSITTHAKDIFQNDPFSSLKLHERFGRARFVVANSDFSADHIRRSLGTARHIHTIYNGLDLAAFPMRSCEQSEPLILGVGRLVEKKGFGDLLAACALLKKRGAEFSCELIGTGSLSSVLKQKIRELGLGDRVRLPGPLPQHVLRQHYERARVFALPCIQAADGDRDILPNVLKEAMAVGVPVITTRLDGIEELIEDGISGLLAPPGNPEALAAKLELLLGDRALRERLAYQGRKVIEERFDRRKNFRNLKSLLIETLQNPDSSPGTPARGEFQAYDENCVR